MGLTIDDVLEILKILDSSDVADLELDTGRWRLRVSRKTLPQLEEDKKAVEPLGGEVKERDRSDEREHEVQRTLSHDVVDTFRNSGLVPIRAPMMGTFYRKPSPGEPPFVEVGSFVEENDTVCLIEVMKIFNAIKAEVRGYIEKICVESGEMVEYGQVLFLVRPA